MNEEIFTYPDGTTLSAEAGSPAAAYIAAMLDIPTQSESDSLEICNDETDTEEETESE